MGLRGGRDLSMVSCQRVHPPKQPFPFGRIDFCHLQFREPSRLHLELRDLSFTLLIGHFLCLSYYLMTIALNPVSLNSA